MFNIFFRIPDGYYILKMPKDNITEILGQIALPGFIDNILFAVLIFKTIVILHLGDMTWKRI